ncbi:hypothetical protein BACEGG_01842 [Bacteroides eggerthii DSM 20697]|nr:hypothetical protein BACEGG_01842 [Bacteroides eggerthii DSM 20697]
MFGRFKLPKWQRIKRLMLYLQPQKNGSLSHHLFIQNASSVKPQQMMRFV